MHEKMVLNYSSVYGNQKIIKFLSLNLQSPESYVSEHIYNLKIINMFNKMKINRKD